MWWTIGIIGGWYIGALVTFAFCCFMATKLSCEVDERDIGFSIFWPVCVPFTLLLLPTVFIRRFWKV